MRKLFASVAILLCGFAAATASAQQMRSYHCIATVVTPGTTHITVYVSQLIPMEANQQAAVSGAWATYIKSNYHLESTTSSHCQPLSTNPAMQEQLLTSEENAWKNQGWDVVHVTWRSGQAAAPPASASSIYQAAPMPGGAEAPAPANAPAAPGAATPASTDASGPRASYCYSDDKKPTIYFSDPFDTAGLPSDKAWSSAFSKFLAQKYMYKGTVTCKNAGTIMNVQSMILEQRDALSGKQIVETDWTYEPPAAPAP